MIKTYSILSSNFKKYDPLNIEEYIALDGFKALRGVLASTPQNVIEEIKVSGLRGRGGAGYPTGVKLEQALVVPGDRKVVICNADEGEPGTFKDRQFLEHDAFKVIEGMIICAFLTGGTEGYMYIREEYGHLHHISKNAVEKCREFGYLGQNILGSGLNFDIKVFSGAGAYVCGEGGALIESIEGKQGKPRKKPPFTKECGLFQLPTLVINVETLGAIPSVLNYGAEAYSQIGSEKSKGTKIISVSGNVKNPGSFEVAFGVTFSEIINDLCGGMKDGKQAKFLQVGGASGPIVPASKFDVKLCYDELWFHGFDVGSGAIVVADESISLTSYLESVYDFFQDESCGKCTPCREGNRQIYRIMDEFAHDKGTKAELQKAEKYARLMKETSFCGLGKTACIPLISSMRYMKDEFKY